MSKANTFFSRFEGTRGEKNQIFRTIDIFGLTFNGLGIDMIWHGVEVNHAVYFVILQDLCLAFLTTLASQIFNWFFWYDDLLWFRFYGLLAMLPFIFHNWAWASVAQLRYLFWNYNRTVFLIILYTPIFLLEIRVIIKISSHPWYPLICYLFR